MAAGRADCGLGVLAAARAFGLDFVPVTREPYDLVMAAETVEDPVLAPLWELLASRAFLEPRRGAGGLLDRRERAPGAMRFEAVVQTEDEGVFVEVPADSEFARARAPVTVTINGQSWESSVADYSGRFYLPLRRGIRQLARIEPGDTVEVTLELR